MVNICNLEQINAQKIKLNKIKAKKQKIAVSDSNELFANIESIKAAQEEQARRQKAAESRDLAAEARKTANRIVSITIAEITTEFSQFE